MNPYIILGVPTDATLKQIKIRHRKLSMSHHPDKGGGIKHFHLIQESYECLSDPERRKHYDETGNMGSRQVDNETSKAYGMFYQILMGVLQNTIKQGHDPIHCDLVDLVRATIRQEVDVNLQGQINNAEEGIKVFDKIMLRFKCVDGKEPFTTAIFRGAIESQKTQIVMIKETIRTMEAVYALCQDIEFKKEIKAQTIKLYTTSTNSYSW